MSSAGLPAVSPSAALAELARRKLAEQQLFDFIQQAWEVVEPSTPFVDGFHIAAIADHLEAVTRGEIHDLIINIPPRFMKSLSVSVFWPAWEWATAPHIRWLFNSYAQSLSVRDALRTRRLIESTWYQTRWGHVFQLASDENLKSRYSNNHGGYRIAASVTGANTGEGGDRIIADDPHNLIEGESELSRHEVVTWWSEVMPSRRNDPRTSARVIVMQRVHEQDVVGDALGKGGWHHLCLPMEYEPRVQVEGCDLLHDLRTGEGELLWPERYGPVEVTDLKKMGPYAWAGQYQQNPVPRSGAIIDPNCFQPLPARFERKALERIQFWDLAFSEKEMADHTAAVTFAVDGDRLYLINVFRERIAEQRLDQVIADHVALTKPRLVGIEVGAFKQTATRQLVVRVQKLLGSQHATRVMPVKVAGDKVFRAQVIPGLGQAGLLFADRDAPWWPNYAAELAAFPMRGEDDQVDATAGAITLAVEHLARARALEIAMAEPIPIDRSLGLRPQQVDPMTAFRTRTPEQVARQRNAGLEAMLNDGESATIKDWNASRTYLEDLAMGLVDDDD